MQRITTTIFILVLQLFTVSCVTVKLADNGGKKASGVTYSQPGKPFSEESRDDVDAAWKNAGNGNVISYISDCGDPSDPSLDHIVTGVLAGLAELKTLSSEAATMQGREARRVHASGKVDGVPTEIDMLAYKRNHCIYILSYVGVQKSFPEDRAAFGRFIQGFRAP